jgi:Tfp pilus assembly protein PilF
MSVKNWKLFVCLVLALGTAIVYWPVHRYEFINYDDFQYVVENPHVRGGLTLDNARWAFTTGYESNWHPLTWVSHMVDVQVFGLNAGAHHTVNVLFHIANTLLLFLALARFTGVLWPSAVVAALFAWHPLHVESVAWIAERKDVLSTFFALLSLWAYGRYTESNRQRYFFISLLWFATGLMAKPMVVTLPFVFLLFDYWPLNRSRYPFLSLLREKVPFFLLAAASSIVTYAVQQGGGSVAPLARIPLTYRLANASVAYLVYLHKAFWPTNLAFFYPLSPIFRLRQIGAALVLLTAMSITAVYSARRRPWVLIGWFWFVGMLVPVIGLVQVGIQSMADRYTYLPLVGIFIILAWSGAEIATVSGFTPKLVAVAGLALLSVSLFITSLQVRSWSDSETVFEHAIAVTKDNYIAHQLLGIVPMNRGRISEAQAQYEEVLRIFPNQPDAEFSLVVIFEQRGQASEAIAHYSRAIEVRPEAITHYNLGYVLMKTGHSDEAITHFAEAIRLDPQMAEAQNSWASVLATQGRFGEASDHVAAALRIKPDLFEARLNAERIQKQLNELR